MRRLLLPLRVRPSLAFRRSPIASDIACGSSLCSRENGSAIPSVASNRCNNVQICLTPAEDALFSFLEYIQRLYTPKTQLRVAGGWVRDKLRGASSADIDIALTNIKGVTFAQFILNFQRARKLQVSPIGIVKANSEKAKHLEVASVTVHDTTVDFVHLRAEAYAESSRVPMVTFASPAEDACRRDLTINALFYNLHTREVEDFTGQGVSDLLTHRIIRTPKEPVQTFLDDPLRVLRALRFACEFGFALDNALEKAILEQREIVAAMRRKVSRERIGIEVRKMLAGKDPARAFDLLRKFGLLELVFSDAVSTMDEGVHVNGGAVKRDEEFKYLTRKWTEAMKDRASHYLHYLQHSRLALANCKISNIESAAAILTPLFLPEVPKVVLDIHWKNDVLLHDELCGITEQDIVESSLEFLGRREEVASTSDFVEIVEMLKVHVKWPKPAGKRVALIIEAVATYPTRDLPVPPSGLDHETQPCSESARLKHRVQQFMWMMQYHSVIAPALTILAADCSHGKQNGGTTGFEDQQQLALKSYLDMANSYAKSGGQVDKPSPCRRIDGKTVQSRLGLGAKKGIAHALRVLHVWEKAYPNASLEDELAFLDRLAPQLCA
uniref:Poly A polymerase head domain-containing protein n=1 Tax=Hyaloperonospora arabidopsidis (strain Emoy2) TaxID=559515 RepID=M4BBR6_HYAAE